MDVFDQTFSFAFVSSLRNFWRLGHSGNKNLVEIGSAEWICLLMSILAGECWYRYKGVDLYDSRARLGSLISLR